MRCRGALSLNGHAFFAIGNQVYDFLSDGTLNGTYGPIADDGLPVYFAAGGGRNAAGNVQQLVFTSGGKAYMLPPLQEIGWLVGTQVTSCGLLDQYFLFLAGVGDGFYYSEPGDALTGNLLNFITAEVSANNFTRLIVQDERVWLFGDFVTEPFFDNSAIDPTNPFQGDVAGVMPQGTCAPGSVIGQNNRLYWIGQNENGRGIAWANNAYLPVRISNYAVEEAWRKYTTISDAVAYAVTFKGHQVVRWWFPTGNETWQYDPSLPSTLAWTKVLYRNPASGQFEADRGSCACAVNGKVLVGDRAFSKVYELSLDYLNDNGDPIRWLRRAPILTDENKLVSYPWFEVDTNIGNGLDGVDPASPESNPAMMFRYSNDWGQTWSSERQLYTGRIGEWRKRVFTTRTGMARQRVFELSGTASVPVVINTIYLRGPMGRST